MNSYLLALQIRLSDPAQYQSIVDAEWNIIYDKLQRCADSGAKVVLSRLAIGDLGTQFFADRDIFCAGRVSQLPCEATLSLQKRHAVPKVSGAGHNVSLSLNSAANQHNCRCKINTLVHVLIRCGSYATIWHGNFVVTNVK